MHPHWSCPILPWRSGNTLDPPFHHPPPPYWLGDIFLFVLMKDCYPHCRQLCTCTSCNKERIFSTFHVAFSCRYGQTSLHAIARDWHTNVAKYFLERGALIDRADKYGRTPLHLAAAVDHHEMVEFLVLNGGMLSVVILNDVKKGPSVPILTKGTVPSLCYFFGLNATLLRNHIKFYSWEGEGATQLLALCVSLP